MTNEIVKQDAQEVQAVFGYEAFREQCAKKLEEFNDYTVGAKECADIIRDMPLPEVTQEPVLFQYRVSSEWSIREQWTRWAECGEIAYYDFIKLSKKFPDAYQVRALYDFPPDAAALRKENEQFQQRIAELESNKALNDVAAERRRQIEVEGFSPERDDMYDCHQLSKAVVCYAIYTLAYPPGDPIDTWPWDKSWWKPSEDERRNRVKAAALLIAEIEHLDRAALKGGAA